MRFMEIANPEDQLTLWRLISNNVWSAVMAQAKQAAALKAQAAANPKPKKFKPKKAIPKPTPPTRPPEVRLRSLKGSIANGHSLATGRLSLLALEVHLLELLVRSKAELENLRGEVNAEDFQKILGMSKGLR